ncbi:phosphatidate cytidylyltransferase [Thermodesulfobacteriota bacterium]
MVHFKRWLTGIIAVPVLIYIIGFGPRWLFQSFIFFAALLSLFEFLRITAPNLNVAFKLACIFFNFFLFYFVSRGPFFVPAIISLWAMVLLALCLLTSGPQRERAFEDVVKVVFGIAYICLPLALLIYIQWNKNGYLWIFFLLSVIFMGDTGAYYVGRAFGKHKLYPSVSPGKTWEGAFGGLLGSLLAALIFSFVVPLYRFDPGILVLVVSLSIFGQIGDLAESLIKRKYGVKDSGRILPGHGGLLDRIDALLFSIPLLYIYITWSISR